MNRKTKSIIARDENTIVIDLTKLAHTPEGFFKLLTSQVNKSATPQSPWAFIKLMPETKWLFDELISLTCWNNYFRQRFMNAPHAFVNIRGQVVRLTYGYTNDAKNVVTHRPDLVMSLEED